MYSWFFSIKRCSKKGALPRSYHLWYWYSNLPNWSGSCPWTNKTEESEIITPSSKIVPHEWIRQNINKATKKKRCLILSIVSFIFSWSNCQEAAIHSWGTRIKKVDLGNFEHWGAAEIHYHPQLQIAAPIVLLKGYPTTRASTSTSFSSKPHNQYTSQRLSAVKESCLVYQKNTKIFPIISTSEFPPKHFPHYSRRIWCFPS